MAYNVRRCIREVGRARQVPLEKLEVGHKLREPIVGYRGRLLVHVGEVLTLKHLQQLAKWNARDGLGKLSHYTREVHAVMTNASGDLAPRVEEDPYQSIAVQKFYRTHK